MHIHEMLIFYHVGQLKSFSQAALRLSVSKSHVSKHISQLEAALQVSLLNRSTRQLSLTQEGVVFHQHCQAMFEQAQLGYDAIDQLRQQATGTLKISIPPALALYHLQEPLCEFLNLHREVRANIVLDSRIEDIVEQGYDLAFRSAILPDSNLIAQKIADFDNVLCVSPAYIEQYGAIESLEDLAKQRLAVYGNEIMPRSLSFTFDQQPLSVTITPYVCSNNLEFLKQMTLSGGCVAILPEFMIRQALQERQLLHCLPTYLSATSPLYAIYPDRKFITLRVKRFVELFKQYLQTIP